MELDEKRDLQKFRLKVGLIFFLLSAVFLIFIARLFYLQIIRGGELRQMAEENQITKEDIPADRGLILDCNGELLATTILAPSIYALPNEIPDRDYTAEKLSQVLGIDKNYLLSRLSSGYRFVWLARQIDPSLSDEVSDLNMPGVVVTSEQARHYPQGSLACHLLGFVDVEGRAVGGVEQSLDKYLRGNPGFSLSLQDAVGRSVASSDNDFIPPSDGCIIKLTIDEWCQRVVESELAYAVENNQAQGGTVVVLEVKTGRVLAMASVPQFDPNQYKTSNPTTWKNPAVNLVYEPGSTMKPLIVASALEKGKVGAYTLINCKGPLQVGEATITDVLQHEDTLSVAQVITKSSNVGIARIAMDLGGNVILHYLELMGIGEKLGIELPNESCGILHPNWVKTKEGAAFTAFGQGLALTPLQLACAINTIANNGVWIQPTIVDSIYDGDNYLSLPEQKQVSVFSPEVAKIVTLFMEEVVTNGGGKLAAVSGYRVAGKTGTSQKTKENGGGYSENNFVASFVGFAPVEDPQVLVLVMIDEPRTHLYGGSVSAPVFSRIMGGILQYLEISPSITKPLTLPNPEVICQLPEAPHFADMTLLQIIKWAKSKDQTLYFKGEGDIVEDVDLPEDEGNLQDYLTISLKEGNGVMPQVEGLSVGLAYEMLINLELQVQTKGDGPLVVEQSPLPGDKLGEKVFLTLGFSLPQKKDVEQKSNIKLVSKKKNK